MGWPRLRHGLKLLLFLPRGRLRRAPNPAQALVVPTTRPPIGGLRTPFLSPTPAPSFCCSYRAAAYRRAPNPILESDPSPSFCCSYRRLGCRGLWAAEVVNRLEASLVDCAAGMRAAQFPLHAALHAAGARQSLLMFVCDQLLFSCHLTQKCQLHLSIQPWRRSLAQQFDKAVWACDGTLFCT